jgi:hypothetical protein
MGEEETMRAPTTLPPRLLLGLAILFPGLASAGSDAGWTPTLQLDPRPPLEIGQPLPGTGTGGILPLPVLFETVPEFQLLEVNPAGIHPTVTARTIVSDGSIFAVGPVAETQNHTWGGSYIDNFGLRFWRSQPPHSSVQTFPVAPSGTWIDSSSAAVGSSFLVSGVEYNSRNIQFRYTNDGGATWSPLRTIQPAQPLYIDFEGGERVSLWTDPADTAPTTARNCVFYETITGATTTKRVNCADGATPVFDVPVAADVPNPGGQFDPFIENRFIPLPGGRAFGAFTRRQDASLRAADVHDDGSLEQFATGPAPPSSDIFGIGASPRPGQSVVDMLLPGDFDGDSGRHLVIEVDLGTYTSFVGPGQLPAGTAIAVTRSPDDPFPLLYGFFGFEQPQQSPAGSVTPALGFSKYPAPDFADGFESGDTSGWSSTTP